MKYCMLNAGHTQTFLKEKEFSVYKCTHAHTPIHRPPPHTVAQGQRGTEFLLVVRIVELLGQAGSGTLLCPPPEAFRRLLSLLLISLPHLSLWHPPPFCL